MKFFLVEMNVELTVSILKILHTLFNRFRRRKKREKKNHYAWQKNVKGGRGAGPVYKYV